MNKYDFDVACHLRHVCWRISRVLFIIKFNHLKKKKMRKTRSTIQPLFCHHGLSEKKEKTRKKSIITKVPDNKMMLCTKTEIANKCQTSKIHAGVSIMFTYSFKINSWNVERWWFIHLHPQNVPLFIRLILVFKNRKSKSQFASLSDVSHEHDSYQSEK